MDKNMTLEKRIAAELYSYQGKMSVFVDDLHGHTVEIGADEEFETASTIKAYILAALYLQASRGKASLEEKITYKPEHFVDGSGMLRALGVGASLKVKDAATMMIVCSDNIATNMVIDYLGLDTINACIREMGFAHTVLHNPLHFDIYNDLGTTTPRDYASLFAQVAKGTQCQIRRKIHHFTKHPCSQWHNGILSYRTNDYFFWSGKYHFEIFHPYRKTHSKHNDA